LAFAATKLTFLRFYPLVDILSLHHPKKQTMKRIFLAIVALTFIAAVSSCRTSKYGCPAVAKSGSSKAIKA
jgi:hypothetical protein